MKVHICIMTLACWFVAGCYSPLSQQEEIPPLPDIGVPSNILNNDLDVSATKFWNSFEINENVTLEVHLKTDIKVRDDFVVEMFILDEEHAKWVSVPNFDKSLPSSITFPESDNIVLDSQNPNSMVIVHPMFTEDVEEAKLLIMIKGERLGEDQQQDGYIGSYIVLTLR